VYRGRIGTPTTDDEACGYWLFVIGTVLGAPGLVLFDAAPSRSTPHEPGTCSARPGHCALVGPTLRLPLSRTRRSSRTRCLLTMLWFSFTCPAGWSGPE
jgi:hypothetical protein